ncbi:MAG: hypothetical protein WBL70_17805 [Candidatus Acidiferrales bacterium]
MPEALTMKAKIILRLGDGRTFEGEVALAQLSESVTPMRPSRHERSATAVPMSSQLDFDLPMRPFFKKYGGGMAGPKRLALLVAYLRKGEPGGSVPRADVLRSWRRMTSLMGGPYNGAYDTRARDSGWVASPKPGFFSLLAAWEGILE